MYTTSSLCLQFIHKLYTFYVHILQNLSICQLRCYVESSLDRHFVVLMLEPSSLPRHQKTVLWMMMMMSMMVAVIAELLDCCQHCAEANVNDFYFIYQSLAYNTCISYYSSLF